MDELLAVHRRDEEEDFSSTVTITRPGEGDPVWNGTEYVAPQDVVYTGAARFRATEREARVVQAGDRAVSLLTADLQVPWDADVAIDDTVKVDESPDPEAVGPTFRIIDVPKTDWLASRTVTVVEEV